ncbi:MFS transporter [Roseibium suaedae]|uniref:MFS transporter, YNFM family, putative membrane transport protein n=1 Tax=Roseibium suaedae TaxID=735517 RepID=A0A1M7GY29_9HYPH|nr:MFS transporter [Roseibium suaedae]SHM21088.1 MFS transporter, YNFM family, putative membrane transport protein [Roseibium suaedae]
MRPLTHSDVQPVSTAPASSGLSLSSAADANPRWIAKDTPDFKRASWALFLAGFASFSLIYCVQPLLPAFRGTYGVNAATASLALSLTTGTLAFAILASGAYSQSIGRRGVMFVSMLLAAGFNFVAAVVPGWHWLLAARACEGLVLGGVPAVAMAYLAEEIDPRHLGKAMGLYVGGTAFGAMVGRVGMGIVSAHASWQAAMQILGVVCLLAAVGFVLLLPPSRNFQARKIPLQAHLQLWKGHLKNPALVRLYAIGAMLTSVFTTVFNYATFRLTDAPFGLDTTAVSMIFLTYALGMVSSAYGGQLADRFGRKVMLSTGFSVVLVGVLLTLPDQLGWVIAGISLITIGFFIGHAAASGAVGANAGNAKSHASSLYLLFYYIGASVTGSLGGWFWIHGGWTAVAGLTAAAALTGLVLSLSFSRTEV